MVFWLFIYLNWIYVYRNPEARSFHLDTPLKSKGIAWQWKILLPQLRINVIRAISKECITLLSITPTTLLGLQIRLSHILHWHESVQRQYWTLNSTPEIETKTKALAYHLLPVRSSVEYWDKVKQYGVRLKWSLIVYITRISVWDYYSYFKSCGVTWSLGNAWDDSQQWQTTVDHNMRNRQDTTVHHCDQVLSFLRNYPQINSRCKRVIIATDTSIC